MRVPMKTYLIPIALIAGLLCGCKPSVESASQDFNSLPEAVQKTIRADAPDAQITSISRTSQNGVEAYKVDLDQSGTKAEMLVAADGRVLSSDLPKSQPAGALGKAAKSVSRALAPTGAVGSQYSALPEPVQKTIQQHAPPDQIANISRHEDNGQVIYEVEFQEPGKNPSIQVAQDGTLVQNLQK